MRYLSLLGVFALMLVVGAGPAAATHKAGHQRPPACDRSQGQAPQRNKHCYPPIESPATEEGRAFGPDLRDDKPPPGSGGGGITVGMVSLAASGVLGMVLLAWWLRVRGSSGGKPAVPQSAQS